MSRTLLVSLIASLAIGRLAAQKTETPPIVIAGLEAYRAFGRDSALATWQRGSPVQGQVGNQVTRGLQDIETAYGPATGHEILANVPIGSRVIRTYVVVFFTKGPMYAWFDCYLRDSSWIMVGFLFNTRPQEILPLSMLAPPARSSP